MTRRPKCQEPPKQMESIDRDDPAYLAGVQAAAAKVPLDMRYGHLWALGWLEHRAREVWSLKLH